MPSFENIINIYKQISARYLVNINHSTEANIKRLIAENDVPEEQARSACDNIANTEIINHNRNIEGIDNKKLKQIKEMELVISSNENKSNSDMISYFHDQKSELYFIETQSIGKAILDVSVQSKKAAEKTEENYKKTEKLLEEKQ